MFEKSFIDNPFAYSRDMLASLIWGFNYTDDPVYLHERERVNTFDRGDNLDPGVSKLLCEIAQQKMQDKLASIKQLDAKRDSFVKFSAGMIVFLAAASKAFSFPLMAFKLSILCFLVSAVILFLSRRVIEVPAIAPIQDLREGIGLAGDAHDWLAGSLHKSCEGYTAIENVIARHINFALWWLIAGLILIALVAIGFQSVEITS